MSLSFAVSIDTVPNIMSLIVLLPIYLSFDFIVAVSIDTATTIYVYITVQGHCPFGYSVFYLPIYKIKLFI
jgi:hypothetical protein